MPTETWLDLMPAIPLARAVPVVWLPHTKAGIARLSVTVVAVWTATASSGRRQCVVLCAGESEVRGAAESRLRADLDDPQGFGYALRWLWKQRKAPRLHADPELAFAVVQRWLYGKTTDADHPALARALAEVTP